MLKWAGAAVLVAAVAAGMGTRAAAQTIEAHIEALCPCDGPAEEAGWASHGDYVACVAREVRQQQLGGLLRAKQMRALIRAARRSTCGDRELTRCCVYGDSEADVGQCRLMSPKACDALDERLFERDGAADDEGSGSCLPNPCVF
jgi:hypothetical protein